MKLFDDIRAKKAKYDERLQTLEAELQEAQEKKEALEKKYSEGLEREAMGGAVFKNEIELQKQIEEVNARISKLPAMIDIVKRGRKQAVAESVPLVREARSKQKEALEKEWEEEFIELKKAQAEVLLRCEALHQIREKSRVVNSDVIALLDDADALVNNDNYHSFKPNHELPLSPSPQYFGLNKALYMGYDVPSYAVRNALDGKLPDWVKHYATTGEIKE
jgi:chromosome segregation ATPase